MSMAYKPNEVLPYHNPNAKPTIAASDSPLYTAKIKTNSIPSNISPQSQPQTNESQSQSQLPMYYLDGEYFVSIDVECAAIGVGHFDSAPCRIAMVDFYGNVLFDSGAIFVSNLLDPLSEFTGLTRAEIEQGKSLQDVVFLFHSKLAYLNKLYKHGVTIIGQSVVMDIVWSKLKYGLHYSRIIDIAQLFKNKIPFRGGTKFKFEYYSLRQCAWALLNFQMNDRYHCPCEDAQISMQLYRELCLNQYTLNTSRQKLKVLKYKKAFPDFKVKVKFLQCSGMYCPAKCFCKQSSASHCNGVDDLEKLRELYIYHQTKPVRFMF